MAERISTAEAARRLGVSVRTMHRLAHAEALPSERVARDFTFDSRDVEIYALRSKQPAHTPEGD